MQRKKCKALLPIISAAPFLIAELVLSYFVQTESGRVAATVMYACVLLAFVFSMASVTTNTAREYNFVRLGLLITLGADYCLVLADPTMQLEGVIVFCFVQLAYFLALVLSDENRTRRTIHIAVRAGLTVLILPATFIILGDSVDALAVFSAMYYANLVCNAVFALVDYRKWWIFGAGLVAFALCDASIGFTFLADEYLGAAEGSFLYAVANSGLNLAWVFYVPSLALIGITPHFPLVGKGRDEEYPDN